MQPGWWGQDALTEVHEVFLPPGIEREQGEPGDRVNAAWTQEAWRNRGAFLLA
jgi:hypothetical protein